MLHKDEIKNGKGFDFCFKMVLVRVRLASCRKMPRIVVMCAFVPRRSICNNCQGIGAHTFFMDGYNRAAVAKQISLYTHSHILYWNDRSSPSADNHKWEKKIQIWRCGGAAASTFIRKKEGRKEGNDETCCCRTQQLLSCAHLLRDNDNNNIKWRLLRGCENDTGYAILWSLGLCQKGVKKKRNEIPKCVANKINKIKDSAKRKRRKKKLLEKNKTATVELSCWQSTTKLMACSLRS